MGAWEEQDLPRVLPWGAPRRVGDLGAKDKWEFLPHEVQTLSKFSLLKELVLNLFEMKNSHVPLDATGDKMVFPLEKEERRNEKKSSFLQDFAEILKMGILGFDSGSNRILFLLHHLVKKQKMWDTHFFFGPRLL